MRNSSTVKSHVALDLRAVTRWPDAQATACGQIATRISYCTAQSWSDAPLVVQSCHLLHGGVGGGRAGPGGCSKKYQ